MTRDSALPCRVCRSPIPDSGSVCHPCTRRAIAWLQTVPVLVEELERTRLRQDRIPDQGPRTAAPIDPDDDSRGVSLEWNDGAARTLQRLTAELRQTAARLLDDLGLHCAHQSCRDGAQPACAGAPHTLLAQRAPHAWLAAHAPELRMREWAPAAVPAVVAEIKRGWLAVDRPEQRYMAGPCNAELGDPERPGEVVLCGVLLWARLDQRFITCPGCRSRYSVIDRRQWLLRAAEDVVAPAPVIASALTLMTRQRVPASTIRSWAHRRVLTRVDDPPGPSPLYRVGDVLDLLDRDEPLTDPHPSEEAS